MPEHYTFSEQDEIIGRLGYQFFNIWEDVEGFLFEADDVYFCSSCGARVLDPNDDKERCNGSNHHLRHSRHELVQYHNCFQRKVMEVVSLLSFFQTAIENLITGPQEEIYDSIEEDSLDGLELNLEELLLGDDDDDDDIDDCYGND